MTRRASSRCAFGWLIAASVVAAILSMPGTAVAQFNEQIDRYDVLIEIQRDGSLRITEIIDYDFGVTQHHGIYRDVPTRLRYDDTYDRVYPMRSSRSRRPAERPPTTRFEEPAVG